MTTFQDPPLQSRRSVRQNERDQSPAAVVPTTGPTPTPVAPEAPGEPLTYTTQARPANPQYEGPNFRARRTPDPAGDIPATEALPQQDAGTYRPRDYSPEGRRSASPAWAPQYGGVAPTPVEPPVVPADPSSTFAPHEPAVPQFDPTAADDVDESPEHTLTRRELRALRDAHGITSTTTGETVYPTPDAAPEAAASAAVEAAPVEAAPVDAAPVEAAPVADGTPLAAPSTRLDSALAEFDQLAAGRPAAVPADPPAARGRRAAAKAEPMAEVPPLVEPAVEAPVAEVPAPVAEAPVVEAPVAEAPALVEAPKSAGPAQVSAEVLGPQPQPIPLVEPPAPQAAETPADGVAVFDALFSAPQTPAEPVAVVEAEPVAAEPLAAEPVAAEPVAAEPVQPVEATPVAPEPQPEIVVAEIVAQPEPVAPQPAAEAPREQIVEVTVVEPSTPTPPTGHWSTQAQLDDETQFGDEKLARNIGSTSGAITTSALVLPSIPDHDFGPLPDGAMVTGSISLPASMSATGAHPKQLDESDLDHLLDPGDHQVANTDSQPVRAIKAVSTHSNSRGVIGTVKPKGTKGLTALIIAATSMAVVVGALFIVLVATGQL